MCADLFVQAEPEALREFRDALTDAYWDFYDVAELAFSDWDWLAYSYPWMWTSRYRYLWS